MYFPWCNLTFNNIIHVLLYIYWIQMIFCFVQGSTAGSLNVIEMSYLFVHQQVGLIPCLCERVFACLFFFYQYGVSLC